MKTDTKHFVQLCIALCLGLTWACVRVDVSVTSPNTYSRSGLPSERKSPISNKELTKRHADINRCPSNLFLAIDREQQKTEAWCWAASTRMVMKYHNAKQNQETDSQCDMVRNILSPWLGGVNCCERQVIPDFINAPSECIQGGWPSWALEKYQFNYEWIEGALDEWEALKGELCKTGPFISVINWSGGGAHAFVVTGYRDEEKLVTIYDPTTEDFQDFAFEEFVGKGPYRFRRFSHDRNYVQIMLPETKDQP
jgi:hypothetical protein